MSYAVIVPVTDLEHVRKEIKAQQWADICIRRTRRQESVYQNKYRMKRKESSDEAVK